ncbi:hypothetical protein Bca52824_038036 [Brassica carinata]|uniref:Uncharacterized protein n=1 Tax=Brassica carinata TaxID=52824 RepID=A0A8X7RNV8_BRACI|nr:hypothetical protein Bca52824_038036 [Brassica carinata]
MKIRWSVLGTSVDGDEPVNLLELSDSSTEEEGDEQLEETESGLVGNPQNEEGAVDGTDNLPILPADVTGEASVRLTAQVVEGGSDRVEDLFNMLLLFPLDFWFLALGGFC